MLAHDFVPCDVTLIVIRRPDCQNLQDGSPLS